MNIRLRNKLARIHPCDAASLSAMSQAVLGDRPSFNLSPQIWMARVSVFTRPLGDGAQAERREAWSSPGQRLELHANDTAALEQLLSDTRPN